jgi:Cu(I)/Ag(I) efflux system membrane fusion protein
MLDEQVEAVRESRRTRQRFEVRSPQDGYIMELNVREGMFVEPGTTIMSLADLSEVWVDVDVFEQQIGWVEAGQAAEMRLPFAPARVWRGEVDYVYPTIRPETRTARVRLAFDNPDLALKPNMYADVDIAVSPRRDVLAVPGRAVIRTDEQERVILAEDGGRFRPAEVVTGIEADDKVEILEGLRAGERIVVSSQFLIDSEASMDASLMRMIGDDDGMDHSGHDMHGMDHSGHDMEGMDHSGHGMDGTDHSGHDMEEMDHSGHDVDGMDHSGHDTDGTDHSGHETDDSDHAGHGDHAHGDAPDDKPDGDRR